MSDRHQSFPRHRSVRVVCTVLATVVWSLVPTEGRAAEPAAPTARRLPAGGLAAYLEYDGLATHRQSWEGTATGAIINRTSAGKMAGELSRQLLDEFFKNVPDIKLQAADVLGVAHDLVDNGFAVAIYDQTGGNAYWVLVCNRFGQKDQRQRLEKLQHDLMPDAKDAKPARTETIRGRTIHHLESFDAPEPVPNGDEAPNDGKTRPEVEEVKRAEFKPDEDAPAEKKAAPKAPAEPTMSYWFEGDDLFIVVSTPADAAKPNEDEAPEKQRAQPAHRHKDHLATVLDVIEGKSQSIATHEGYVAAIAEGKDVKGFEGDGVFFVELGADSALFKALSDDGVDGALAALRPPQFPTLPSGRYMHDDVQYFPPGPVTGRPSSSAAPAPVSPAVGGPAESLGEPAPASVQPALPPMPPDSPVPPSALRVVPGAAPSAPADADSVPIAPAPASGGRPLQGAAPAPVSGGRAVPGAAPSAPDDADVVPAAPAPASGGRPVLAGALGAPSDADSVPDAVRPGQDSPKEEAKPEIDELELLGLRGMKRFIVRWGFEGKGLVTIVRAETPAPRQGAMTLIDQPGFAKDSLPPIPKGVTSFVIGSFDPLRSYDAMIKLTKSVEPAVGAVVKAGEQGLHEAIGLRLREDLLAHVGPTWCTFDVTDGPRDPSTGLSRGQVIVARLHDADAFLKVLDRAATQVNRYLKEQENGGGKAAAGKGDQALPALTLERLPAPDRGYALTSPAGLVFWLDDDIRPTVLVGKSFMVLAANPDIARAVLAAETKPDAAWRPKGELARTFADLPGELTSLSVADTAGSPWPDVIAKLPAYVQLLANMFDISTVSEDTTPVSAVLAIAGVPRATGFRVRLDASMLPKASAVREHLFPSVLATTVDDRGLRWIGREAFPLAGVTNSVPVKPNFKIDLTKPAGSRLKFDLGMPGVKVNSSN